jgi:hypothetical protein
VKNSLSGALKNLVLLGTNHLKVRIYTTDVVCAHGLDPMERDIAS